MSKLNSILRDVGYASVGAAAALVEGGGKIAKTLVRKGEKTLHDNQDTVDDLKRRVHDLSDKAKSAAKKVVSQSDPTMDASRMTAEERAELRRQLDEADQAAEATVVECEATEAEDDQAEDDAPAEDAADRPAAPDVIYHAAPDEHPEDSANG